MVWPAAASENQPDVLPAESMHRAQYLFGVLSQSCSAFWLDLVFLCVLSHSRQQQRARGGCRIPLLATSGCTASLLLYLRPPLPSASGRCSPNLVLLDTHERYNLRGAHARLCILVMIALSLCNIVFRDWESTSRCRVLKLPQSILQMTGIEG